MNEQNDTSTSQTSELSPEAGIVCPACLEINLPRSYCCAKCAAPLSSLVAFNPFDQTLVEGFGYRRAVEGPPSKIVLIGMWILFGPMLLATPFIFFRFPSDKGLSGVFEFICSYAYIAVYLAVSPIILYRTTVNFISKRKAYDSRDSQAAEC